MATRDPADKLFTLATAGAVTQQAAADHTDDKLGVARRKEQEKNRRAQARFRERQKAKHGENQRRMAELETAVQQLQMERDALAVRADTLERCVLSGGSGLKVEALVTAPQQTAASGAQVVSYSSNDRAGYVQQLAVDGKPCSRLMNFDELALWWKERVQELAPLLVQAQFDASSAAGQKIAAIWRLMLTTSSEHLLSSVELRTKVYTQPLLAASDPPAPPPDKSLWKHLTESLQLSAEQQELCRGLRREFLSRQAELIAQRAALSAVMEASVPDCDANPTVAEQHSKALQAMEDLHAMMKQEQAILTELAEDLFGQVLTPIQSAYAVVGLWPWVPDKLAMLNAIDVAVLL